MGRFPRWPLARSDDEAARRESTQACVDDLEERLTQLTEVLSAASLLRKLAAGELGKIVWAACYV